MSGAPKRGLIRVFVLQGYARTYPENLKREKRQKKAPLKKRGLCGEKDR